MKKVIFFLFLTISLNVYAQFDNPELYFYKRMTAISNNQEFHLNIIRLDSTINCSLVANHKSVMGNGTILPSDKLVIELKMGELRNEGDSIPSPVYLRLTFISDSQAQCVYFDNSLKDSLRFVFSENYYSGSVSARYFKESAQSQVGNAMAQVTVAYPEIFTNNPETASKINRLISQSLFKTYDDSSNVVNSGDFSEYSRMFLNDFKESSEDSLFDSRSFSASWYEESYYYITYNDNYLLSLEMLSGIYTGGAHPNSSISYLNIDTHTGEKIEISDIIEAINISKLNAIGEEIFRNDNNLSDDADLDTASYWLKNNTFELNDNFMLLPDGLLFTFVPYEISSYARGYIDVFIPHNKIVDIIREDSPLGVFINKRVPGH